MYIACHTPCGCSSGCERHPPRVQGEPSTTVDVDAFSAAAPTADGTVTVYAPAAGPESAMAGAGAGAPETAPGKAPPQAELQINHSKQGGSSATPPALADSHFACSVHAFSSVMQ